MRVLEALVGYFGLLFVPMILFLSTPAAAGEPETKEGGLSQCLFVTTEKTRYKVGEGVKIAIENRTDETVYAHVGVEGIKDIEKMDERGGWERLSPRCQPPHCFYDIGPPEEIGPSMVKAFVWKPLLYVGGTARVLIAPPGTYRFSILWQDHRRKEWKIAYSTIFEIERP